jgi:ribonucleotide reductase alpha subunit
VQGLADAFIMLRLPFTSDEAKTESRNFETMYFAAVTASMEMAKEEDRIQVLRDLLFHKGISVQFMGINRC